MSARNRQARARKLEHDAADAFQGERVVRAIGECAPDVKCRQLPNGDWVQVECKSRKRLPAVIMRARAQAIGYAPGCIPLVVVRQVGGAALAVVDLEVLARWVGLDVSKLPKSSVTRRIGISNRESRPKAT